MVSSRAAIHPHGPGNGAAPLVRQGAHRVRRSTEPDHSHQGQERGESDEKKYTAKIRKTQAFFQLCEREVRPCAAGPGAAAHHGAQDRRVPFFSMLLCHRWEISCLSCCRRSSRRLLWSLCRFRRAQDLFGPLPAAFCGRPYGHGGAVGGSAN